MKSKDLQKTVLSRCQNGDTPTEICCNLNGEIVLRTIKRCCQMIRQSDSIILSAPPVCPCFVRTKGNIQRITYRLCQKKRVSVRKLSTGLGIFDRSIWRIIKNDLGLRSYKIAIEPLLFDDEKIEPEKVANWIQKFSKRRSHGNFLFG